MAKRRIQEQFFSEAKTVIEVIPASVQEAHVELSALYVDEKGVELLRQVVGQLELSSQQKQV